MAELNELRESYLDEGVATSEVDEITFRNHHITPQEGVTVITQGQVTTISNQQQQPQSINSQQHQRARAVNITYQGTTSQVQTASSMDINQQQRISSSQYQAPSGASYVRITTNQPRVPIQTQQQPNVIQTPPGVYIPQGMNIAPIRQPIPISQSVPQQGNRIIVGGQIHGNQVVMGSFPQNPQNLRY